MRRCHAESSCSNSGVQLSAWLLGLLPCSLLTSFQWALEAAEPSVAGEICPRASDLGPGTGGSGHFDQPAEVLLRLGRVPRLRGGHACSVEAAVAVGLAHLRGLVFLQRL